MGCSRPALGPLSLLLTACTALGASEDILEPMPPVTPLDDLPQDERIEGTWVSTDCGARLVPRRIAFEPSGRFVARDDATPCAPPEECAHQGTDSRSGIWTIDDDGRIALLVQEGSPAALDRKSVV